MGATHAANLFFRFPDRFNKVLALSGIYDMSPYIYDGNFDENFYKNNPMSYLPNMPHDHEYIQKYNQANAVFVVGQGAWENECQNDLRKLADVLYKREFILQSISGDMIFRMTGLAGKDRSHCTCLEWYKKQASKLCPNTCVQWSPTLFLFDERIKIE